MGWPADAVHYELFAPVAHPGEKPKAAFEVFLSRRKQTLAVPPGRSILDVVRDAGVDIDSSCETGICETGICGTCRTRLISGTAEHRDDALTPAEKAANSHIMICVSRAPRGERLVLDL